MNVTYRREGDYLLPNLTAPERPNLGKYGMLRRDFLRDHRDAIYTGMLLTGKLDSHLVEIDRQAAEMAETLTEQFAQAAGVTEELKASDQMKWVGLMNDCKAQAEEIVLAELVYA